MCNREKERGTRQETSFTAEGSDTAFIILHSLNAYLPQLDTGDPVTVRLHHRYKTISLDVIVQL